MYISYDEYLTLFSGRLSREEFEAAEPKAEAHLRYLTYINGDIFAKPSQVVKVALCAIADIVAQDDKNASARQPGTTGIKSESNDGYSVTYLTDAKDGQTADQALRRRIYESARLYLLPTGWLRMRPGCHRGTV